MKHHLLHRTPNFSNLGRLLFSMHVLHIIYAIYVYTTYIHISLICTSRWFVQYHACLFHHHHSTLFVYACDPHPPLDHPHPLFISTIFACIYSSVKFLSLILLCAAIRNAISCPYEPLAHPSPTIPYKYNSNRRSCHTHTHTHRIHIHQHLVHACTIYL